MTSRSPIDPFIRRLQRLYSDYKANMEVIYMEVELGRLLFEIDGYGVEIRRYIDCERYNIIKEGRAVVSADCKRVGAGRLSTARNLINEYENRISRIDAAN